MRTFTHQLAGRPPHRAESRAISVLTIALMQPYEPDFVARLQICPSWADSLLGNDSNLVFAQIAVMRSLSRKMSPSGYEQKAKILACTVLEQEQKNLVVETARDYLGLDDYEAARLRFGITILRLILAWFRLDELGNHNKTLARSLRAQLLDTCFPTAPPGNTLVALSEMVVWAQERISVLRVLESKMPEIHAANNFSERNIPHSFLARAIFDVRMDRARWDVFDSGASDFGESAFPLMSETLLSQVFTRRLSNDDREIDFAQLVIRTHNDSLRAIWSKLICL